MRRGEYLRRLGKKLEDCRKNWKNLVLILILGDKGIGKIYLKESWLISLNWIILKRLMQRSNGNNAVMLTFQKHVTQFFNS